MISIEDLSKTQLILLTLLVTFITSIGTGIITTSLLAEAPVSVTQTINRVVERTIETVVPTPAAGKEPTISEKDRALLAAVELATQAVVRVEEIGSDGQPVFHSLGVIVAKDGMVISRKGDISATSTYIAVLSDKTVLPLELMTDGLDEDMAVFKIGTSTPPVEE
ncbi:MAG: hypothetical protein Q8O98_00875 [bacterium]|nr:hypothetical protein [bacterium]